MESQLSESKAKKSQKILIVDDEAMVGNLLQDMLGAYDFESTLAEDEEQAVQAMNSFKPTVALVDYKLVRTTGFEVSKSLKAIDEDLPVILMTAYPSMELVIKAIHSGIYDFLAKPIDKTYLLSCINKAAEKRTLTEENKRLIVTLQEKNQVLEKLNLMKSKFLSIVTHDLRTPLVSIKGYAELLETMKGLSEQDKAKSFKAIQISVDRMNGLINNLLDMVSIESGRLRVERKPIDFIALCKEVQETLASVASSKKIGLEWSFPAGPLDVNGDPIRLVQVLTNLITNAFKHTEAETGKIKVVVVRKGGLLRIETIDNGEGIAPKQQTKIFEQYYQVETSQTRREGIGLGLSIAREIIHAHQGEIGVVSEGLGKGSAFWFTLPLIASGQPA